MSTEPGDFLNEAEPFMKKIQQASISSARSFDFYADWKRRIRGIGLRNIKQSTKIMF